MSANLIEMKFFRVSAVPAEPEANAIYLIRDEDSGKVEVAATGANGALVRGLTSVDVMTMIEANVPEVAASASKLETARTISLTGDGTWEVTFNGEKDETAAFTLTNTGVVEGEYSGFTIDSKGRVTAARALEAADLPEGYAKGVANGLAELDENGLVKTSQLPGFVDDVIEVAAFDQLPGQPNTTLTEAPSKGKIYVVVTTTPGENEGDPDTTTTKIYRWAETAYVEIPSGVGTADTALKLHNARTIAMTGDATWEVSFDGSGDRTAAITLADTGIVAGTYAGITFDSKGRAIEARALIEDDLPEITATKVLSSRAVVVTGDWDQP